MRQTSVVVLLLCFSISIHDVTPREKPVRIPKILLPLSVSLSPSATPSSNQVDTTAIKQSGWYNEALKNINESEYNIQPGKNTEAYTAPNRSQDIRSYFTSSTFTITPRNE